MESKYNLEALLIGFASEIMSFTDSMVRSKAGKHLGIQLVRCATSPVLDFGGLESKESIKDYIQKLKIVLSELQESKTALKRIAKLDLHTDLTKIDNLINECDQLISIFGKSVERAERNNIN